jgi:Asp-tRNA(Asn)/Glu-tRNA(Gln) amidotransferase B subunit
MMRRWMKWAVLGGVLLLTAATPVSMAQAPSSISIYSIWIRLSLRGLNQNEIESLMRNMDPAAIAEVKKRLRDTVLSNLETKHVAERFLSSRDSDDLKSVLSTIETELRFAALQNDDEIKLMIRDRFGIPLGRL